MIPLQSITTSITLTYLFYLIINVTVNSFPDFNGINVNPRFYYIRVPSVLKFTIFSVQTFSQRFNRFFWFVFCSKFQVLTQVPIQVQIQVLFQDLAPSIDPSTRPSPSVRSSDDPSSSQDPSGVSS